MSELRRNLTSGTSYLTQHSEDPESDGEILADNFESLAERLFGDEYTDTDMEYVIALCGSHPEPFYNADTDVEELVALANTVSKKRGGKGWL